MTRYRWIVPAGAALIGWVTGETIASDGSLEHVIAQWPAVKYVAAAMVLTLGMYLKKCHDRAARKSASTPPLPLHP